MILPYSVLPALRIHALPHVSLLIVHMHLYLSELKTQLLLSEYSSGGGGLSRVCAEVHCSVYQLTVQLAKCLPQQTMHTVRMYVFMYVCT